VKLWNQTRTVKQIFHAEYAEIAEAMRKKMFLYEGIHGGAHYACATIRMASTNKVCALPRILRILREIFLSDGNMFFEHEFLELITCNISMFS
jgi:hypothetical protein